MSSVEEILPQADKLCDESKAEETYALLKKADADHPDNVELVWRLARASHDMADFHGGDKALREKYIREGLELADKALKLDPNHYAPHKWTAILKGCLGDFLSTNEKIQMSFTIKESALKAAELKPGDSTTQHVLGVWCYKVASVSWLEKKAASMLFSTPPESSYEEALTFFKKADECSEGRFKRNAMYLADTYGMLKDKENAKLWYGKTLEMIGDNPTSFMDKELQAAAKKGFAKY
eukprot:GFYU01005735.1.p1 GENE.GFYU01005735.1~~GFYU01005735.1.p1  ORF type:complete len:244 (+),score=92.61 GFYU01005735.1:22-732(+)